jgi:hypothetical protein
MNDFVWEYSLTHEEEWLCCEVGFERQKPYGGMPEKNRNYSEGDRWEVFQHIQCAEAELAAARLLGHLEFKPHYNTFKTELDIPQFEVRYSRSVDKSSGHGIRYSKVDNAHDNVPYILMIGGQELREKREASSGYPVKPYKALGWMWSSEIKQEKFASWNGKSYFVPEEYLRSMEELLPIRDTNLGLK